MNTIFADAAGGARGAATPPAARPLRTTLVTLVRREFWEYRALWLGPAVAAALLALAAISAHVNFDLSHEHDSKVSMLLTPAGRLGLSSFVQWVLSIPLYLVMLFVLSYYLLDCLHAERKDRSILFWKSLPVSDGLTVGSKLLVACVVVPLGVFLLATLAYFVFSLIIAVRVAIGTAPDLLVFDALSWLQVEIVMLGELLLGVLWYAPVAACLLLLSAAVRRPFLWATLPPVAIVLERIALGTHHFVELPALSHGRDLGGADPGSQHQSRDHAVADPELGHDARAALRRRLHRRRSVGRGGGGRGPGLRHHPHPPLPRRDLARS